MKRLRSILPAVAALLIPAACFADSAQAGDHGALGVSMSDRPSDNAAGGVMIEYIYPGSPAAQIGLLPRDRILSVANQPVADYREVVRLIAANAPYAQVKIEVARGNWRGSFTPTLRPAQQVLCAAPVQAAQPVHRSYSPTQPRRYNFWNRPDTSGAEFTPPPLIIIPQPDIPIPPQP